MVLAIDSYEQKQVQHSPSVEGYSAIGLIRFRDGRYRSIGKGVLKRIQYNN